MEKMLIADFIVEKAHKTININMIDCFAGLIDIDLVSVNHYYDDVSSELNKKGINIIDLSIPQYKTTSFGNRQKYIKLIKETSKIINAEEYDCVLVLAFEIISLFIAGKSIRNSHLILTHHNDIDELTNRIKLTLFKSYMNHYHHIVFEDAFNEYLVEKIGTKKDLTHTLAHPVSIIDYISNEDIQYDCIGLCNANTKEWIQSVEEQESTFSNLGLKVLLRSKDHSCRHDSVEIIRGFLSSEEYNRLYFISRSAFIAIPESYVYRLSGSTYDALSRRRIVFTTSKFYGEEYSKKYPGICIYVSNVNDLINKLKELEYSDNTQTSFDRFILDHSVTTIRKTAERILNTLP